jgi:hypothetical protein
MLVPLAPTGEVNGLQQTHFLKQFQRPNASISRQNGFSGSHNTLLKSKVHR